jgi:thermolabile hemolysin
MVLGQGNREAQMQSKRLKDTLVVFGGGYEDDAVNPPNDLVGLHRYSTGPVWPQYLAELMNMRLYNYAVSGALTLDNNLYFNGWSGNKWQTEHYLKQNPRVPNNVLIGVATGAINEMFANVYTDDVLNTMVNNIIDFTLKPLIKAGATQIFVLNLPDYTLAPGFIVGGLENRTAAQNKATKDGVISHNLKMAAALKKLAKENSCVQIVQVDFFKFWNDAVATKEYKTTYGFECTPGVAIPLDIFTFGKTSTYEDIVKYAFYDAYHPATIVHQEIATNIQAVLKAAKPSSILPYPKI